MKLGRYRTITGVRQANKAGGHYFFERGAMKTFFVRIETGVYSGKYFVDSMQDSETSPRVYKVRYCDPDGAIKTLPHPTPGYPDKAAAIAAMQKAIREEESALMEKELRT